MIRGKRVRLRSFELSDVDEIMEHWNNMELRNLLGSADRGSVGRGEEEECIRSTWKQRAESAQKDLKLQVSYRNYGNNWITSSSNISMQLRV